jgi:hypothetical protein
MVNNLLKNNSDCRWGLISTFHGYRQLQFTYDAEDRVNRKYSRNQNMAYRIIKNMMGFYFYVYVETLYNLLTLKYNAGYTVFPGTVHPDIIKSRISWYKNRPKDFSAPFFLSTTHNCEPLPVVQHQTVSS